MVIPMLAVPLVAAFQFFVANVNQAKIDMGITERTTISMYDVVRVDVHGREASAWTERCVFSEDGVNRGGFQVGITRKALKENGRPWLQKTAYHEVCHMLSGKDQIMSGILPSKKESDRIEARAERCADIWMENLKARKQEKKAGGKHSRFWEIALTVFLAIP